MKSVVVKEKKFEFSGKCGSLLSTVAHRPNLPIPNYLVSLALQKSRDAMCINIWMYLTHPSHLIAEECIRLGQYISGSMNTSRTRHFRLDASRSGWKQREPKSRDQRKFKNTPALVGDRFIFSPPRKRNGTARTLHEITEEAAFCLAWHDSINHHSESRYRVPCHHRPLASTVNLAVHNSTPSPNGSE